jgi:uncharacterized protein (DUF4415 family)
MKENRKNTKKEWVDPDDAPELTDSFFEQADEYVGDKLIRRGRPPVSSRKILLSVRYSAEVVEFFRSTGEGWQSRMNDVLKEYVTRKTSGPKANRKSRHI